MALIARRLSLAHLFIQPQRAPRRQPWVASSAPAALPGHRCRLCRNLQAYPHRSVTTTRTGSTLEGQGLQYARCQIHRWLGSHLYYWSIRRDGGHHRIFMGYVVGSLPQRY